MQEVKVINPFTLEESTQVINSTELVHAIDSSGKYQGLVPRGTEYLHVNAPPSDEKFTWSFLKNQWEYIESLDEVKQQAILDIDNLAGYTRQRYITSIPGQDAVYAKKLEEAQEYLSTGVVGPYLTIEAATVNKDVATVANDIVDKATIWSTQIGHQIEGIRRKNKILVQEADTVEKVYMVKAKNLQDLSTL